jgi:hypothetical protein
MSFNIQMAILNKAWERNIHVNSLRSKEGKYENTYLSLWLVLF